MDAEEERQLEAMEHEFDERPRDRNQRGGRRPQRQDRRGLRPNAENEEPKA